MISPVVPPTGTAILRDVPLLVPQTACLPQSVPGPSTRSIFLPVPQGQTLPPCVARYSFNYASLEGARSKLHRIRLTLHARHTQTTQQPTRCVKTISKVS